MNYYIFKYYLILQSSCYRDQVDLNASSFGLYKESSAVSIGINTQTIESFNFKNLKQMITRQI